jgi:hypothetical protein
MDFMSTYAVYSCANEVWCPLKEADSRKSGQVRYRLYKNLSVACFCRLTSTALVKK